MKKQLCWHKFFSIVFVLAFLFVLPEEGVRAETFEYLALDGNALVTVAYAPETYAGGQGLLIVTIENLSDDVFTDIDLIEVIFKEPNLVDDISAYSSTGRILYGGEDLRSSLVWPLTLGAHKTENMFTVAPIGENIVIYAGFYWWKITGEESQTRNLEVFEKKQQFLPLLKT